MFDLWHYLKSVVDVQSTLDIGGTCRSYKLLRQVEYILSLFFMFYEGNKVNDYSLELDSNLMASARTCNMQRKRATLHSAIYIRLV